MKKIIHNKNVICVYDGIDELPIINFQKFNKFLLIDSGIGSDIDDIDRHAVYIAKLINTDKAKALQELQNMRQNMHMISSEISPKYMAFASLIYSINGKRITDYSDDNLKGIIKSINTIKHCTILSFITKIKKKVETELDTYFPSEFTNAKDKEAYDNIKRRALLILNSIITGNDNAKLVQEIDDAMLNLYKPKSFIGSQSVEIEYDKQFETACLILLQKTGANANNLTTLQFYNSMQVIKKQAESELKYNKRKRNRLG